MSGVRRCVPRRRTTVIKVSSSSRESSVVVRPIPPGSAFYTAGSRLQAAGLKRAITLFEQAAQVVPIPPAAPPRPIVLADYGAANGHNSLLPISAAIAVLRQRTRTEHSIMVTHTDVPPDNDFSALFHILAEDPDSYLKKDPPAAYASAVGRSYYAQIIPSNSVNLGWSAWSVLWLGRVPPPRYPITSTHPSAPTRRCARHTRSRRRSTGMNSWRSAAVSCVQAGARWCSPWPSPRTASSVTGRCFRR